MKVLLAEDNPVNQEIAAGLLEVLGCAVTVVENGRQAVDATKGGAFDLVFMDCEMTGDGRVRGCAHDPAGQRREQAAADHRSDRKGRLGGQGGLSRGRDG
ncbi:MAG: response regulator [Rhizobiales bacterium]|nr:response regulator [Hyphomicrobiales bacterium]